MQVLVLVLLILAAVCFGLAAFARPAPAWPGLVPLGLLAWVLSVLVARL